MTAEQEARDLLEKYGLGDAQSLSAGDVVESQIKYHGDLQ